jgi:hypothetical protein
MSKIKMRCITCGKWFQSANAKEVTCPDCAQKARREKQALKNAPPATGRPVGPAGHGNSNPSRTAPPPKPKTTHSGTSHWLDTQNDVKVGQPDQSVHPKPASTSPVSRDPSGTYGGYRSPGAAPGVSREGERGPNSYREGGRGPASYREGGRGPGAYREGNRGPGAYREGWRGPGAYRVGSPGQHPRQPMEGEPGRGPQDRAPRPPGMQKPKTKVARPPAPPKPRREKTPPPLPFVPTPEQITMVEERYLELSAPGEFDGIRTQIAKELNIPKKAVKKIIKDLRARQDIPSWWELQTYKGSTEELEKIKAAYEPYLPVPPVGVHKQIGDQLGLKSGVVYQAIKAIRIEMNLPQYNDPSLHEEELAQIREAREKQKAAATNKSTESTEASPTETTPPLESAVGTAAVSEKGEESAE